MDSDDLGFRIIEKPLLGIDSAAGPKNLYGTTFGAADLAVRLNRE